MLVLTRRNDETIVINGNIIIKIYDINKDKVKVAIDAPRDIIVDRGEIHKLKQRDKFVN